MKTKDFKTTGDKYVIRAFEDIISAARHINHINGNVCRRNAHLRNSVIESAELAISNFEIAMKLAKSFYKTYASKKRYNKRFINKRYAMRYNVVQSRGCGIEYVVFGGTLSECKDYIWNVATVPTRSVLCGIYYTTADPEEVNGNNQPFDYYIKATE